MVNIKPSKGKFVFLKEFAETLKAELELGEVTLLKEMKGRDLEYVVCHHPFYDRDSLVLVGQPCHERCRDWISSIPLLDMVSMIILSAKNMALNHTAQLMKKVCFYPKLVRNSLDYSMKKVTMLSLMKSRIMVLY